MNCEICRAPIIQPSGMKDSKILIVGEFPTNEDMAQGRAFVGQYGKILRSELAMRGMDISQMRLTCLWLHNPSRNSAEKEWHVNQLMKEVIDKQAVLLLGSEVTNLFLKHSWTDISGIPMKSDMLSAELVMGTRNPLDVITGTSGEFSMGIAKFCRELKKRKIYRN